MDACLTQGYGSSVKPEIIDAKPALSGEDHRTAPRLAFELLESKFHPPVARPGIVARAALVDRLAAAQAPVTCSQQLAMATHTAR